MGICRPFCVSRQDYLNELHKQAEGMIDAAQFQSEHFNLRYESKLALESLDLQRILAVVNQSGKFNPELKQILSRWVTGYNYPQILAVLSKLESQQ
jgi:hypothetical protein